MTLQDRFQTLNSCSSCERMNSCLPRLWTTSPRRFTGLAGSFAYLCEPFLPAAFGYDSLEELRRTPRERLYADPRDRARLLHLLATQGEFRNEEIEYINRYGNRWWGLCNSVAIRDPETGVVLYHVGSVKDISGRKQAQAELLKLNATLEERVAARTAELKESEEKFRALFEGSSTPVMLHDEHQYLEVNSATLRLLGYKSREDFLGLHPGATSPPVPVER